MLSRLRFRRHRERAYTWLIALAGIFLAVGAAWLAGDYAVRLADEGFRREVAARSAALDAAVAQNRQVVRSLGAFFATRDDVTLSEFHAFVDSMRAGAPGIQALVWAPRVVAADRASFEQRARADFPDYALREPSADWQTAPAAARTEYYPVRLVAPVEGNGSRPGLDLAADPLQAAALARAKTLGDVAASERLVLMEEGGMHYGVMLAMPVVDVDGRFRGYVAGVFRIGEMLETAISRVPAVGLNIMVTDATGPGAERALHVYNDRLMRVSDLLGVPFESRPEGAASVLLATYDLRVGDRTWRVYFEPGPGYFAPLPPLPAWLVAVLVLLVTGLLTGMLLLMQKRAQMLARQSLSDGLTGLANRTFGDRTLVAEWDRAVRYGKMLSVVLADIDRFGDYNAQFGPLAGDECLRRVARAIAAVPGRSSDMVCRYAGDRFLIVLPETTHEGAHGMATRLVGAVRQLGIPHPGKVHDPRVSITAVAATTHPHRGESLPGFMERVTDLLDAGERGEGDTVLGLSDLPR